MPTRREFLGGLLLATIVPRHLRIFPSNKHCLTLTLFNDKEEPVCVVNEVAVSGRIKNGFSFGTTFHANEAIDISRCLYEIDGTPVFSHFGPWNMLRDDSLNISFAVDADREIATPQELLEKYVEERRRVGFYREAFRDAQGNSIRMIEG